MKSKYLLLLFLLMNSFVHSQDINFMNPENTYLQTNPAFVAFDDYLKLSINYRSEYSKLQQNFNTQLINLSFPLLNENKTKRKGGFGFSMSNERFGEFANLSNTGLSIAYAYNFYLTANQSISASLSGAYFRRGLSTESFTTGSQYVPNQGFDNALPINEEFVNGTKSYFDLSTGIIWQLTDEYKKTKYYFGISVFHLAKPNISFTDLPYNIDYSYSVQSGIRILDRKQISLNSEIFASYYFNQIAYNIGLKFNFPLASLDKNTSLSITPRYISAGIIATDFEFNMAKMSIAYCYNLGIYDLSGTSSFLDGNEMMLQLRYKLGKTIKKVPEVKSDYKIGEKYDLD